MRRGRAARDLKKTTAKTEGLVFAADPSCLRLEFSRREEGLKKILAAIATAELIVPCAGTLFFAKTETGALFTKAPPSSLHCARAGGVSNWGSGVFLPSPDLPLGREHITFGRFSEEKAKVRGRPGGAEVKVSMRI